MSRACWLDGELDLGPAAQSVDSQRNYLSLVDDSDIAVRSVADVSARTWSFSSANQSATKQISKIRIFHGANDLTLVETQCTQDLDQVQCSKVINVLYRIVKEQGSPAGPGTR